MTRKEIGDGQRRILVSAIETLGEMSLARTIYDLCKVDQRFAEYFDCKDPYERMRTLLQRGCPEASQGFRGRRYHLFAQFANGKATLWGLRRWLVDPPATLKRDTTSVSEREPDDKRPKKNRTGQAKFRERVILLYGGRCAFTNLDTLTLLAAAHIKPWEKSNDDERQNPYNGILLPHTLHTAFDAGLFTIYPDGELVFSPILPMENRLRLGLCNLRMQIHPQQQPFFKYHRDEIFKSQ